MTSYNAAELIRQLNDRLNRLENQDEPEGAVQLLRNLSETETSSDSVSTTTQSTSGWDWSSDSTWGFDSW